MPTRKLLQLQLHNFSMLHYLFIFAQLLARTDSKRFVLLGDVGELKVGQETIFLYFIFFSSFMKETHNKIIWTEI